MHPAAHIGLTRLAFAAILLWRGTANAQEFHPRTSQAKVLEEFEVDKGGDLLIVPVAIEGAIYNLLLDTGCTACVYDSSLRPLLGEWKKSVDAHTATRVDGVARFDLFESPTVRLGRIPLSQGHGVLCTNARMEVEGGTTYGMVGMEAIRDKIMRLDFDEGKVAFLDSVGENPGHMVPLTWHQPRYGEFRKGPYVDVDVEGYGKQKLLVDTGCVGPESGMLIGEFFDVWADHGVLERVGAPSPSRIQGKPVTIQKGTVTITVGGIKHEKVAFCRMGMNALGLGYLSRYVVTFDFPHDAMYLREGKQFDRPDVYDLSGMHVGRVKNLVIVRSISERSAADDAGLRRDDVIMRIDDRSTSELSTFEVRRQFCLPGARKLDVRRGDEDVKIDLLLSDSGESTEGN